MDVVRSHNSSYITVLGVLTCNRCGYLITVVCFCLIHLVDWCGYLHVDFNYYYYY